ncbi:hypothetical protein [Rickettsiella massiliensis]|uniref:hypothetical protein n=1 Tax=Rickettsiella massiliensis TaxID=676517 RepID=UPI00029ADD65|nr:hypothetical protein [Rickettsiella massiliensis]
MENNAMMLLMTDKGMQRMRELIAQGSEISLFIALGSGQKKPSKATTTLSEKQEEGKITLLSTINPKENSWHINAHFSPTDLEYDITEIGLFINDIKKLQADTLWGIYFSESAIAKKHGK